MKIGMQGVLKLNGIASIVSKRGIEQNGAAQRFLTSEVARMCDSYVPMLTGALKNTKRIAITTITYVQPYAKKNYYGNKGNGKRGKLWDKRMMADHRNDIVESVAKFVGGRTKK